MQSSHYMQSYAKKLLSKMFESMMVAKLYQPKYSSNSNYY